ncbi:MAG: DUF3685 domain-containing protein [Leptolyngbyaceae cyanobacterium bins.349]|nr:DUF3685 domain-containing protein [Leptolyngbyaceae cyanobacterium bins.349]
MLIDNSPQWRRGFAAGLTQDSRMQVVLEADSESSVIRVLQHWLSQPSTLAGDAIPLDLIILSLDLPPSAATAIALCQTLRQQYPAIPILTTSAIASPALLSAAFRAGARGYCQTGTAMADWIRAIGQVVAGYPFWEQGMGALAQMPTVDPLLSVPLSVPPLSVPSRRQQPGPLNNQPGPLNTVRRHLRQSGLAQIDAAIAQINDQLRDPTLTRLDQLVLTGRRRELRASRWLVSRLLTTPGMAPDVISLETAKPSPAPRPSGFTATTNRLSERSESSAADESGPSEMGLPLTPQVATTAIRSIQAALFDTTFAKLQLGLRNLTDTPLEIDILRDDRKRELLTIVLRKLEEILAELRLSQIDLPQLDGKQDIILLNLWQATTTDFFGRYTTLPLGDSPADPLNQTPIAMVEILLQDEAIVQAEILGKIPLFRDFLAHLLFQVPLMVDETNYGVGTVEAMTQMEVLLQNLMIQVSNAVIQPLLNRFGNVVAVKQNFYDRRLLSTREIERFRNNLSWKYRVQRYFKEPTAIFESRYSLFGLGELGIVNTSIYSPRSQELDELAGLGLAVTVVLEARDAIAPRLRSAISFVGSGVVYVLTEVIGRGIGLIGRGIIKGVGNVMQDPKFTRNDQRWRG